MFGFFMLIVVIIAFIYKSTVNNMNDIRRRNNAIKRDQDFYVDSTGQRVNTKTNAYEHGTKYVDGITYETSLPNGNGRILRDLTTPKLQKMYDENLAKARKNGRNFFKVYEYKGDQFRYDHYLGGDGASGTGDNVLRKMFGGPHIAGDRYRRIFPDGSVSKDVYVRRGILDGCWNGVVYLNVKTLRFEYYDTINNDDKIKGYKIIRKNPRAGMLHLPDCPPGLFNYIEKEYLVERLNNEPTEEQKQETLDWLNKWQRDAINNCFLCKKEGYCHCDRPKEKYNFLRYTSGCNTCKAMRNEWWNRIEEKEEDENDIVFDSDRQEWVSMSKKGKGTEE